MLISIEIRRKNILSKTAFVPDWLGNELYYKSQQHSNYGSLYSTKDPIYAMRALYLYLKLTQSTHVAAVYRTSQCYSVCCGLISLQVKKMNR